MQKNDLPCAAARDLMPLVKEGLVSSESRTLVEAHVLLCPACQKEWAALQQETPLPLESAPLVSLHKKLGRQSVERALLWALLALLALSLALIVLTHRTPLRYQEGMLKLYSVMREGAPTDEAILTINNRAAEYALDRLVDAETGDTETLLTAWTTPLSRWRGAVMPRTTLVKGDLWYASCDSLDVRVLPEGAKSAGPSNRMTLPRLALAYYLYAAGAAMALALLARFFIKQQNARRAADALALLGACYIAAHILVMGFTTVSCFMTHDFLCILLVTALLFGAGALAVKRRREKAGC